MIISLHCVYVAETRPRREPTHVIQGCLCFEGIQLGCSVGMRWVGGRVRWRACSGGVWRAAMNEVCACGVVFIMACHGAHPHAAVVCNVQRNGLVWLVAGEGAVSS